MKKIQKKEIETKPKYPMRINKYLAFKGFVSRREADEFIKRKKISINGKIAVLGDKVMEKDIVKIDSTKNAKNKSWVYFAYNKPKGIVTTNPQGDEKEIKSVLKIESSVFPIGRLDKDSSGLIILSNDGRITHKMLDSENGYEKEYIVKVNLPISKWFLRHMSQGIDLSDGLTLPCKINQLSEKTFSIILTEGRNRQIRRMTEMLNFHVTDLKRVRIGTIKINNLNVGMYRKIEGEELSTFLKSLNIRDNSTKIE